MRCAWMPSQRVGDLARRCGARRSAASGPACMKSRERAARHVFEHLVGDAVGHAVREHAHDRIADAGARIVEQPEVGLDALAVELDDRPRRRCDGRRPAGCRPRCRSRERRRRRDSARAARPAAGACRAARARRACERPVAVDAARRARRIGLRAVGVRSSCDVASPRRAAACRRAGRRAQAVGPRRTAIASRQAATAARATDPSMPARRATSLRIAALRGVDGELRVARRRRRRGSEKSTPAQRRAARAARALAAGSRCRRPDRRGRSSVTCDRTLPAPGDFVEREPALGAQRLDARHVAARRNADHPHAAAFDRDLHALAVGVGAARRRTPRSARGRAPTAAPASGCDEPRHTLPSGRPST